MKPITTQQSTTQHFPACFVELPASTEGRRAAFYLAAEEWITKNLPCKVSPDGTDDSYLFTWQLRPTVVMGRNQIAHQEVDIDFCRRNNIDIIRRRSGGGAIFADEGNIMISLITTAGKVEPLFAEYAETVAAGLRSLGANVEVHGRNDIILLGSKVEGQRSKSYGKVCGNAFYHLADRNIVHGTMLYTTDPVMMQGALKPLPEKLKAKGVQSVRARVGVLAASLPNPLPPQGEGVKCLEGVKGLRQELRRLLTDRSITIPTEAIKEIEEIERGYYDEAFIFGSSAKDEEIRGGRIEGCGSIEVHFKLKGSIIRSVSLAGDFFEIGNAEEAFNEALQGVQFTDESIAQAIREHHPETKIRNLNADALIEKLKNEIKK